METGSDTNLTGTPSPEIVPTNTTITNESALEETPQEESSDGVDENEVSIDLSELEDEDDNGLAANIGEFIGNWFSTWWGWLISIAVLLFLIFLVIRRREEE